MPWPSAPVIFEINTLVWLREASERLGGTLTLADVPEALWDETLPDGVDAVWLMGVWDRSPVGLEISRGDAALQRAFRAALPDFRDADNAGSPYCVRRYVVDEALGGPPALAVARAALARRGLRLVLDYVPNHVAPDHPWVTEHPEYSVRGTPEALAADGAAWLDTGDAVIARGRDPYFAPWPDVVQLNAFHPRLRDATATVLASIGEQCDGVRCDMAMLLMNDVFARTWSAWAGDRPAQDFWPDVLGRLRERHADLVLIAEAYWNLEWSLQRQGFDFCYDKRLYDRLVHDDAAAVRGHLHADLAYQERLLRFVENHDEPRAATALPGGRDRAAAVTIATLPGAALWHEGQLDGRTVQLPVFLARRPDEKPDGELRAFYGSVLRTARDVRRGAWRLLDTTGWPDNDSFRDVVAWAWSDGDAAGRPHHVVVVNLSGHASQARVPLPWPALAGSRWSLSDALSGKAYDRDGDELSGAGLYVDLPAWACHVLAVGPTGGS
jgi:hypothetical protein